MAKKQPRSRKKQPHKKAMAGHKRTQKELEVAFVVLKASLADVEAGEEQRVMRAIAPAIRRHNRILARSRELGDQRVYR